VTNSGYNHLFQFPWCSESFDCISPTCIYQSLSWPPDPRTYTVASIYLIENECCCCCRRRRRRHITIVVIIIIIELLLNSIQSHICYTCRWWQGQYICNLLCRHSFGLLYISKQTSAEQTADFFPCVHRR